MHRDLGNLSEPELIDRVLSLSPALVVRGIGLRAQRDDDRAFLRDLYGEQRAAELASAPWPESAKAAFLDDQFRLQSLHFSRSATAELRIVTRATPPLAARAIGRLYLDRSGPMWQLLEIGLIAAERGGGLGGAILGFLQAAAIEAGATGISLNVVIDNARAVALYRRLGFRDAAATSATHRRMEWRPDR